MSGIVPFDPGGASAPAISMATGRVNDWHSASISCRDRVECAYATFEITAIAGEQESLGAADPPLVLSRSLLSSGAFVAGCDALELRYVAEPNGNGTAQIRMFVTARSSNEHAAPRLAALAATQAVASLPPGYTRVPTTRQWLAMQNDTWGTIFELRRIESVTAPVWQYVPADFYYHISETPGDGSGWKRFWHALARVESTVTISILFKQTELDQQEQHIAASITTQLAQFAVTRQDYNMLGYQETYPGCENAAIALAAWQDRMRLMQRPLLGRVAVRGDFGTALPVATSLASAISQSADPKHVNQPMEVEAPYDASHYPEAVDGFERLDIFPWGGSFIWGEPSAPRSLRRFPYLYGIDEAAALAVLPIPDEQGVPGFTRGKRHAQRRAMVSNLHGRNDGVLLGQVLHEGVASMEARLPLSAINRHVLVCGTPGSGKTTTVLTLLSSLWRDFKIPFLVIEPTKSEYRTLLNVPGMEELRVIVLGRDDVAPMRLNPMAPPDGVRMEVQANAVLAALKASLPLFPPLPQLLEESIERAYRRAGWHFDTTMADGLAPPTLRTVMACFHEAFEETGYQGEARNVAAAMETRLKSLVRGSKGRVLDTVESMDFGVLATHPVIIEMDEISDPDDKAVLASLILDRMRANARLKGSSEGKLRHVTVLEEAHRLLTRYSPQGASDGDNPRAAGVEAFCNAIAELRSVGEGFILSSQSPSRLAAAAVDNCGTRILHRIESSADRDSILADFDANQVEREAAARLSVGEAIARWPDLDEPEFINVVPGDGIDSGRPVSVDEVRNRMLDSSTTVRKLLPYQLCTRDVCSEGCDPATRHLGEDIASSLGGSAQAVWEEHQGSVDSLPAIAKGLRREANGHVPTAYCGAVHLAVSGKALEVRRNVDIRPLIRAAIEVTEG